MLLPKCSTSTESFFVRNFRAVVCFNSWRLSASSDSETSSMYIKNENYVIYCTVMFTDIKLQPYGVRIDILWVLWDELRNWDDINWAGNWVTYDMKFILDICCKKSPSVTIKLKFVDTYVTPARTHSISGLKSRVLKLTSLLRNHTACKWI